MSFIIKSVAIVILGIITSAMGGVFYDFGMANGWGEYSTIPIFVAGCLFGQLTNLPFSRKES